MSGFYCKNKWNLPDLFLCRLYVLLGQVVQESPEVLPQVQGPFGAVSGVGTKEIEPVIDPADGAPSEKLNILE